MLQAVVVVVAAAFCLVLTKKEEEVAAEEAVVEAEEAEHRIDLSVSTQVAEEGEAVVVAAGRLQDHRYRPNHPPLVPEEGLTSGHQSGGADASSLPRVLGSSWKTENSADV